MSLVKTKLKKIVLDFFFGDLIWLIDSIWPKRKNYWGFPVHHIKSEQFVENPRAVFEEVKGDKTIKKIVFTRDKKKDFFIEDAENYEIVKLVTLKGLFLFLRCKILFVAHSLAMDYSYRYGKSDFSVIKLNLKKRYLINLWHGIVIKRLYGASNNAVKKHLDRVKYRNYERKHYAGLICSSNVDSYAMATIFHPINYENVWITGLPRNDFLLMSDGELPQFLENQINILKQIKKEKKLIVYAPTYRQTTTVSDSRYYQFSKDEIKKLKGLLRKHNVVLGFRMHYFRNSKDLFNFEDYIDNELIFDVGHNVISEIAPIIREADIVITDYSSVFMEALYIDKPVFAFAYDYDHYKNQEEGFLYNFKEVFPGPISYKFKELIHDLDIELSDSRQIYSEKYKFSKHYFYQFNDANNSERVIKKVKNLTKSSK